MRAIKERAGRYTEQAIVCGTGVFSAYIAGAAEQWAIDVEKACKWLERANSALPPCYKMFEVNIENFRKAMEE